MAAVRPIRGERALIALAFLGFASLGLPDAALGVAWPSVRSSFGLPLAALGALLARASVGALLALSCAATGATLLGYAAAPSWGVMSALGLVGGLGFAGALLALHLRIARAARLRAAAPSGP